MDDNTKRLDELEQSAKWCHPTIVIDVKNALWLIGLARKGLMMQGVAALDVWECIVAERDQFADELIQLRERADRYEKGATKDQGTRWRICESPICGCVRHRPRSLGEAMTGKRIVKQLIKAIRRAMHGLRCTACGQVFK